VRFTESVVKDGLRNVASHHIESFNFALGKCLPRICKYMLPVEAVQPTTQKDGAAAASADSQPFPFKKFSIWFESFELRRPVRQNAAGLSVKSTGSGKDSALIYPSECRLRSLTYQAPLFATLCRKIDDEPEEKINISLGEIPVMVRS
jgi:DNA-directed RNA polymerase I subunit RPA2